MNIPINTIFAGVAIFVSIFAIFVSIFSYIEGRKQVDRQNSFELRLYIITILDTRQGQNSSVNR